VVHHRTGWLNPIFEGLSYAGRFGLVWIALAALLAAAYRRWGTLAVTVIAIAVADWVAIALKALTNRPRPPVTYAEPKALVPVPHDGSFPSGHAATSFAAATTLSFAFPRLAPPLFLLAGAIGFSRVYVGVHYPLDVIAGAALGAGVATALRLLARARLRSRPARRRD
jgi:undecaprenyl-diphosphatase